MNAVKSKSGNRTIPLPDALKAVLLAHQERTGHKTGLVFRGRDGGPIDINSWRQRRLVPLLEQLGIPRAGLHAFRHALASALVATGANPKVAQAQLGHSDIRQTLDLYTHIIGDEQREAVERAAESFISTQPTAPSEAVRDFSLNVLPFTNKGAAGSLSRLGERCAVDGAHLSQSCQADSLFIRSIFTSPSGNTARISSAPPMAST